MWEIILKQLLANKKKAVGAGLSLPILVVLLVFTPSPRDIVYADLDKRYAQTEQIQQQILLTEKTILCSMLESQIYDLEKLEAGNRATPEDIARKNKLIRQLEALRQK